MNRLIARRTSRLALGLLLLGALVCPALADVPMIVDDARFPSPVAITGTSAYFLWHRSQAQSYSNGKTMTYVPSVLTVTGVVCFSYTVHGPRPAANVKFSLAAVNADGTVLGVDVISVKSSTPDPSASPAANPAGRACRSYDTSRDKTGGAFDFAEHRKTFPMTAVYVSAREITYDDGTTWLADQAPVTGTSVTLPAPLEPRAPVTTGLPLLSVRSPDATPFTLTGAYDYESTRDAPFTMKTLDDGFFVCADANLTDPRKPRATHLGFVLVDRTGIVFAIVPVESRYRNRAFNWAHSDTLCRIFARPSEGNAVIFTPPGGAPTEVGRIVAIPLSEDFWDGSSWTSMAVPLLGQPLPAP